MIARRVVPLALAALLMAGCSSSGVVSAPPSSPERTSTSVATSVAMSTTSTSALSTDPFTNPPRPEDPAQRAALTEARARWATAGPRTYGMRIRYSCFCALYGPWDVVVRDGIRASAVPLDATSQMDPGPFDGLGPVEHLFDLLDRAVRGAGSLDVTYDAALGFPADVSIDWITNAIDDEVAWTMTSLTPGEPVTTSVVTGPGRPLHEPTRSDLDELAAAQARWDAAGLTAYSFRIAHRSGGSGRDGHWDVRIEGDVNTTTAVDPNEPQGLSQPPELVDLPALLMALRFEIVAADALSVDYDPVYGFPVRASIDRNARRPGIELSWEIESFTAG